MVKLYDAELSGNCYKVRLFLSVLGVEHELFCRLLMVWTTPATGIAICPIAVAVAKWRE